MDMGADAMPMPDRLWLPVGSRFRSRSPGAAAPRPAPSVADETLLRHVADGDAAALAALYRRYGARLFGFLQRYAGDRMVAEEIMQDTLLAVWRSAHLYEGRSGVRTWLFGVARRQAHNRLRGHRPEQVPLDAVADWADPAPGPAEWAVASAQSAAIAEAFDALSGQHREVLALAFASELPHGEIAKILSVPVGTVKSRLHHARAALARALADRGDADRGDADRGDADRGDADRAPASGEERQ
jgi:RNA polymerase sigma-70 factor, ECF subfamily